MKYRKLGSTFPIIAETWKNGTPFAIISAWKTGRTDNSEQQELLKDKVMKLGYPFLSVTGHWEGSVEDSLFIGSIPPEVAKSLAMEFEQDSYLCGGDGVWNVLDSKTDADYAHGNHLHIIEEGETYENYTETDDGTKFVLD